MVASSSAGLRAAHNVCARSPTVSARTPNTAAADPGHEPDATGDTTADPDAGATGGADGPCDAGAAGDAGGAGTKVSIMELTLSSTTDSHSDRSGPQPNTCS